MGEVAGGVCMRKISVVGVIDTGLLCCVYGMASTGLSFPFLPSFPSSLAFLAAIAVFSLRFMLYASRRMIPFFLLALMVENTMCE